MRISKKTRILIVEDDMIIAANISLQLTKLGYEVTGIVSRGEDAIAHIKENETEVVLMGIRLRGDMNGIMAGTLIQQNFGTAIVYLATSINEATFAEAKQLHPHFFISKPFNASNLKHTLELVEEQLKETRLVKPTIDVHFEVLHDRIFVRQGGKMTKLMFDSILYVEAERNYSNIVTPDHTYMMASTLKTLEEKLPLSQFVRVHRSFIINLSKLDVVAEHHLEIQRKSIPFGKSYKHILLSRIQMI